MLGTGVFVNTVELAKRTGGLGFLCYMIIGVLMLPLIISFAHLLKLYPTGGFYGFATAEMGPLAGFISTWSYFIAKMASAGLMVHVSISLLQKLIPFMSTLPALALDAFVFALFTILNLNGLKTGSRIQAGFMVFKLIPLLFAIFAGFYLFNGGNFIAPHLLWQGIPTALPLVLYVALGFEASVALSNSIENAEKNAPRAIFISYGIVMLIVCLYQLMFFASSGMALAAEQNYLGAFPILLGKLFGAGHHFANMLGSLLYIAVACSALGGCYGIMFSNNWNLHMLAKNGHLFGSKLFSAFNKNQVPFACIIAEGILGISYLLITGGNQLPLQQISGLGSVLTYTFSIVALALAIARKKTTTVSIWIARLAIANCLILMGMCIRNFFISGVIPLIAFVSLLGFGILMFFMSKQKEAITTPAR